MSSELSTGPAIRFDHVSKAFGPHGRSALLRKAWPSTLPLSHGSLAVDDVSFAVAPGEALGIIGANGAGKSTVLRLAAGIMEPAAGTVTLSGRVTSIIELGLAFHPDLTGKENLLSAAVMAGLDAQAFVAIREEVIEFSGVGEYLDLPMKHLSTGMAARLGFALAVHVPAPVLLVDEVLSVGDSGFQNQCVARVRDLVKRGTALLFVSHDLDMVAHVCDRALVMEKGRVIETGRSAEVVSRYARAILRPKSPSWRTAAFIESVNVAQEAIPTGGTLCVESIIDVVDTSLDLKFQSELYPPSVGVGTFNTDILPATVELGGHEGRWLLRSEIGPLNATAVTLELAVSLVEDVPDGTDRVVDRLAIPVEIVGEEMGGPKLVVDGRWEVISGPADDLGRPVRPKQERPAEIAMSAVRMSKRFDRVVGSPFAFRRSSLVALDEVSFVIGVGETVGLIGPNGAGKSTILRILAGASQLTSGSAERHGSVVALLELGAGFHPDLTGRENVEFAWRLHGGNPKKFDQSFRQIVAMASIGPVLDQPVKHYSTGMRARLSVALALVLKPDILLVDEALSVGDLEFRERVKQELANRASEGYTTVFASHDLHLVGQICQRVLRVGAGQLVDDDDADSLIERAGGRGWLSGSTIVGSDVLVRDLVVRPTVVGWDEPMDIEFTVEVHRAAPDAYLEFSIRESLDDSARAGTMDRTEVSRRTMCMQRQRSVEHVLIDPGVHRVHGRIEGVPVQNSANVVVSVIDSLNGDLLSEQWAQVRYGDSGASQLVGRLVVRWDAMREGEDLAIGSD